MLEQIRRLRVYLLMMPLLLVASVALAVQPDEILPDPALEARARALSAELRCVVCQNQSIDDSNAPLARDLRLLVRERLIAGDSDAQVKAFVVERYGTFVLLKPPFDERTLLLWLTPLMILIAAVALIGRYLARAHRAGLAHVSVAGLTREEEERLDTLLRDDNEATSPRQGGSPGAQT